LGADQNLSSLCSTEALSLPLFRLLQSYPDSLAGDLSNEVLRERDAMFTAAPVDIATTIERISTERHVIGQHPVFRLQFQVDQLWREYNPPLKFQVLVNGVLMDVKDAFTVASNSPLYLVPNSELWVFRSVALADNGRTLNMNSPPPLNPGDPEGSFLGPRSGRFGWFFSGAPPGGCYFTVDCVKNYIWRVGGRSADVFLEVESSEGKERTYVATIAP
jgi:hypothetical protein